jgi:hypothetical protein
MQPLLPTTIQTSPLPVKSALGAAPSTSNRRATGQWIYPLLLIISTAFAALFCVLYITKPVISTGQPSAQNSAPKGDDAAESEPLLVDSNKVADSLLPQADALPGDAAVKPLADARSLAAESGSKSTYEETNLQIQHVLSARGPAGEDLGKINLKVPVLYRSRALRWTPDEIEQARNLVRRIEGFQENSRMVRDEGAKLLSEWNALVGTSIPIAVLRADSPSISSAAMLPENAAGLDSSDAIQIQNR